MGLAKRPRSWVNGRAPHSTSHMVGPTATALPPSQPRAGTLAAQMRLKRRMMRSTRKAKRRVPTISPRATMAFDSTAGRAG